MNWDEDAKCDEAQACVPARRVVGAGQVPYRTDQVHWVVGGLVQSMASDLQQQLLVMGGPTQIRVQQRHYVRWWLGHDGCLVQPVLQDRVDAGVGGALGRTTQKTHITKSR